MAVIAVPNTKKPIASSSTSSIEKSVIFSLATSSARLYFYFILFYFILFYFILFYLCYHYLLLEKNKKKKEDLNK
jgi:hypothetical protein